MRVGQIIIVQPSSLSPGKLTLKAGDGKLTLKAGDALRILKIEDYVVTLENLEDSTVDEVSEISLGFSIMQDLLDVK